MELKIMYDFHFLTVRERAKITRSQNWIVQAVKSVVYSLEGSE